jgi:O-antigen ligase
LGHQPAHSLNDRTGAAHETIAAFKEHPFVGRSLGGVSVYIASRYGIQVTTLEQAHTYWGFPVLMDVLVASGIWGFIPFLMFLYANTFGALKLAQRRWPEERAKWLRALARAMIFEWLVLMTDQNLLRVYIWFHISMVAVIAYNLEFGYAPASLREPAPSRVSEFGEAVPSV